MRSGREGDTEGMGFRPAHWAWTTITTWLLLVLQGFAVLGLGIDIADSEQHQPTVLEAFERGFALALAPVILVAVIAWRLRRKGTEVDERASAAFGVLAVVVLVLGLACAFFHLPEAQEARLSVETALWVLGGALLATSLWMRHVPRPWWPRDEVSH